jgi:flagellar assembly protein FliH
LNQVRKFAFETEFAPDGEILNDSAAPPTRLSREEADAMCAAAYEKGKADAVAEAERAAAAALNALAQRAETVLSRLNAETQTMRIEPVRVALAAARKIAGAALDGFGAERAAGAIEAAMDALRHQPRLLVRLNPKMEEVLKPRIEAMAEAHGYAGVILLRADERAQEGEISIDWSDGVVTLDPQDVAQRIEALMDAALAAPEQKP